MSKYPHIIKLEDWCKEKLYKGVIKFENIAKR